MQGLSIFLNYKDCLMMVDTVGRDGLVICEQLGLIDESLSVAWHSSFFRYHISKLSYHDLEQSRINTSI